MNVPKNLIWLCGLSVFFLSSLLISVILPWLKSRKMQQIILEEGPRWHKPKEGTPTMGGLGPAVAVGLVGLLFFLLPDFFSLRSDPSLGWCLLYALGCGGVGIADDLTKFRHRRNAGLTPGQKLILQFALSGALVAILFARGGIGPVTALPLLGLSLSWGAWILPILAVFAVGTVNFANLTDGIDGLAAAVNTALGACYVGIGLLSGKPALVFLASAMAAGAFSFLLFNYHPAKLFMGDTGSLFFGGLAVGCALLSERPFLLLLPGIVYYAEGLSVILQVGYFKLTRKRLFLMAPFHHHLERSGWSEEKIVFFLTALTLLGSAVCILLW